MTKEQRVKVLDQTGQEAGVATRTDIEEQGLVLAVVLVVLFNSNGEFWLQMRVHDKSTHPGKWDVTASGCVNETDSTNLDAALRELKEEAGLSGLELRSAGVKKNKFEENGKAVVRYPEMFFAITDEIPKITDDEAAGYARFDDKAFEALSRSSDLIVPSLVTDIEHARQAYQKHLKGDKDA